MNILVGPFKMTACCDFQRTREDILAYERKVFKYEDGIKTEDNLNNNGIHKNKKNLKNKEDIQNSYMISFVSRLDHMQS